MTPAMAATMVRLRYAGDRRPVEIQQTAREAPEAHPERVGVKGRAEGATARWFDELSKHGGAKHRRWRSFGDCGGQNEQSTRC